MELFYAFVMIFGAGVIRGYSGFGFAMICAITLAFIYPPPMITPIILCLDITASVWLFYKVRTLVDWKDLRILFLSAMLTIPIGSLALTSIPVDYLRIFIALTILLLCAGLLIKTQTATTTSPIVTFGVGMLSGFLTGVAAMGGPPVILFYLSSNRSVTVSRASLIAFFLVVDFFALISCFWYGLLDSQTLALSAKMLVQLSVGILIGNYLFEKFSNEEKFRRQTLTLLMVIALISLAF
jgi:uncharacterized membrane protein YfcA